MTRPAAAWAWLDGSYVGAAEARVRADDAGLLYGRGLYETFRARHGSVYRLEDHRQRLQAGARMLGIALPTALAQLPAIVRGLAQRCELEDARVRLTLTAGPVLPGKGARPSLLLQARPATDYPEALYERGMSAMTAPVRRNETSSLSGVKSLNCLDNLLSREWARAAGADTGLLLNTRGLIAEASTSNVFLVRDGELLTPPVQDGALPGITRGAVLELAVAADMVAREASLRPDDLRPADEAFLTNAAGGVMPLVSLDSADVGSGRPGEITLRIRALYEGAAATGD